MAHVDSDRDVRKRRRFRAKSEHVETSGSSNPSKGAAPQVCPSSRIISHVHTRQLTKIQETVVQDEA